MQKIPTPISSERRRTRGLPVQLKYAVMMTLVGAFTTLVMIFVVAWFIQQNNTLLLGDELAISAQVVELVRREQQLLEFSLFLLFLFSITVTFGCAFYITRKLTGPMMALQRQLWLYSRGDWTKTFRLRQNDEFRELEPLMSQLRDSLLHREKAS